MNESNDVYYTRCVIELADSVPVITSQAIFSVTGMKLVNPGVRLNSSFFERLAKHNLLPPLEQCLQVENGIDHDALVEIAKDMIENEPALQRVAQVVPDIGAWLTPLKKINLSEPVVFLLTLAREQRPQLLKHSVRVALISIYIGIRVGGGLQQLTVLASAGLFHDLGELRIDANLQDPQRQLTPEERALLRSHPAISQHVLLNAAAYPVEILGAVAQHHEYIDGSGYPFGMSGSEMSRYGRMLSLAEAVANKLDMSAVRNEIALEFMLKLNAHKFDTNLLSIMSVFYTHGGDAWEQQKKAVTVLSVPQIHYEIEKIGLALNYWQRLLDTTPAAPRSAAAFIQHSLVKLAKASRAAGINPADKHSLTAGIEQDAGGLFEVEQLSQEALQQVREIVFEIHQRWPDYHADTSQSGEVVNGWMEHMEELLLGEKERVQEHDV